MLTNIFEKDYIELFSPQYIIKSWTVIDGKPWKTKTINWKDLLPGDYIKFESILDFGLNKVCVNAYRNSELLWSLYESPKRIRNMLSHFVLKKINI